MGRKSDDVDDPHDYEGNDYDDLGCGDSFCTICGGVDESYICDDASDDEINLEDDQD